MKILTTLLLILLIFALLNTGTSAQTVSRYQIDSGVISGGGYQLVSFEAQVATVSTGGTYSLVGPATPSLQGSGCCCTYLPCALKNR